MTRRISVIRPSQVFDSFMDEFFGSNNLNTVFHGSVDVDMFENESHVIIKVKAPGFDKDDIKITVEDNTLTIEGSIKEEKEEKDGKKWHMKEIKEESFSRTLSLPTRIKADQAEAKFKNGIMEISLPKADEVKPKTVTIKAE